MNSPATKSKKGLSLEATLTAVLSHHVRVRCFVALSERPASATQLMHAWGLPEVGLVSYHIDILKKLGIVEEVDSRPVRGSTERFYKATTRPMATDEEFERMSLEERDSFTKYILQLHVTDAALAVDQGTFDRRSNRAIIRLPMHVDEEGFAEMAAEEQRTLENRMEIEARSAARMAEREQRGEDAGSIPIRSMTMFFEAATGGGALDTPPPRKD
jgi:hypothetical protein